MNGDRDELTALGIDIASTGVAHDCMEIEFCAADPDPSLQLLTERPVTAVGGYRRAHATVELEVPHGKRPVLDAAGSPARRRWPSDQDGQDQPERRTVGDAIT